MQAVTAPILYGPEHDRWLERWHALLEALPSKKLIEIGCGAGHDSAYLSQLGFEVHGIDMDREQVRAAQQRCPQAQFVACDLRDYLRTAAWQADVVVASLSLHYFDWQETIELFNIIHKRLAPNAVFLLRLNSTNDQHYGAQGHPLIDHHYYTVDGQPKRFFDLHDIEQLMGNAWQLKNVEERVINRYSSPKTAWEIFATPKAVGDHF